MATPDRIIARFLSEADLAIQLEDATGRNAARELMRTLAQAEADLRERLNRHIAVYGEASGRFGEAQITAYMEQTRAASVYVQSRMRGLTTEASEQAARLALTRNGRLLVDLDKAFRGVVTPPRLFEGTLSRVRPSLIASSSSSIARYGVAMERRILGEISTGIAEGLSQREMVDRLVNLKGPRGLVRLRTVQVQPGMRVRISDEQIPEGLFVRHRSWAWRIVRTEVANAQNMAALEQMRERAVREPDLQKKIYAVFDKRTAWDSIAVHGQVRPLEGYFRDGAGRVYQRPPARPHDRETIAPFRKGWPETRRSRPLTTAEQDAMWAENQAWQREQQKRRRNAA